VFILTRHSTKFNYSTLLLDTDYI